MGTIIILSVDACRVLTLGWLLCMRKPLPSCDHFQLISYRHMSPEQLCGRSPSHFHASSHSSPCAVKKLAVHFHSQHQRGERRSPGSQQSQSKKGQQRNRHEEKTFDVFFQRQCKTREQRSLSVSCPCVQQRSRGQRRNRSGLWGQGQGGLQGRRWSSLTQMEEEEEREEEEEEEGEGQISGFLE